MPTFLILYDGWNLIHRPLGPSALHLLALLAHLPPQVQPVVALPAQPPSWMPEVAIHVKPMESSSLARLKWEQSVLPRLASEMGVQLLHLASPTPPLWGPPRSVVSPSGFGSERGAGFTARLREALAEGGLARARALFWPNDLPALNVSTPILNLPPVVHPGFTANPGEQDRKAETAGENPQNLPDTYILYHGPTDLHSLQRLLDAWSWVAGPIGDYYPLLLLGLDGKARSQLRGILAGSELGETVRPLPEVAPGAIPALYWGCSALFHPAPISPWGGPLRHALACGRPVVAAGSPLANALAGPAAYLVPENDARRLGAALITVIVEEQVASQLSQAAHLRAAGWQMDTFGHHLQEAYQRALTV